jgi:hypothetical protein
MICNRIDEFSIKHIDGQLEAATRCEFEKHMIRCRKCQIKYNEIRNNYDTSLMVNGEVYLTTSVMKQIYSMGRPYKRLRFVPILTGFAEIAAFVLILFLLPAAIRQHNNPRFTNIPNGNPPVTGIVNKTPEPKINGEGGIIITLKDKYPTDRWEDVIHDYDIISVVGELKGAGGDSISINGELLTNDSEIIPVGAFILIRNKKEATNTSNGKTFGSPFVIRAKGNPDIMLERLASKESIMQQLRTRGIYIAIENEDKSPEIDGK